MELGSLWVVVLCVFGALVALQWLLKMDRDEGQTSRAGQSLKQKLEPGFQDQTRACKVLAVEDRDKEGLIPAVQSNSTTTTTSFPRPHWDYDVFLSFRGEDTRKNFTDHLYSALTRVGIHTFRDEEELEKGTTISTKLRSVIHKSKISIVVFSKCYASSTWCLDELVEILHCKETMGHTLFPIFYHVDPSDLRKQAGSFAEAFVQHERRFQTEMERVLGWKTALNEAGNCAGWDAANRYESRLIEEIVEEVSRSLNHDELKVARHPIGINYRVARVENLLNLGANDVRMVGINGIGGIGKTTLAKAVYNQVRYGFEASSCLLNIKQNSEEPKGLVPLQKQLLYDILKIKDLEIASVDRGINLIEEKIYGKKVLIVLDDVDDPKQFYELLGSSKIFGPGSRVIVTTRDEVVLTNLGVDDKYKVEELGEVESLQLFNLNAFSTGYPKEDYMELSSYVVKYCGGLPLALEVLGSSLIDRSVADWKMELEKLSRTPHPKIQEVLLKSFESLDDTTKNIFLDIACFFVGKDKDYVIKILEACHFFLDGGINTLLQRSLVTIDPFDLREKLKMHDLIRDMGRQIVQEKLFICPGMRSRLWSHEDILNVLRNHMGTMTVEGIISNLSMDIYLDTKAFRNMKKLRFLQINGVHLTGSYEYLSKELRLFCWHNCPLKFLPQNFHLENLVNLDMQQSDIEEVWKSNKKLNKLKVLNLKDCKCLIKSPDFSQVPQLEILILEGCISLVQVHESIGYLKRLVSLNFGGCKKLWNLPSIISNLNSLEILNLSSCLRLQKLPEDLGNMMALKQLLANGTAIEQLPSSISLLKKLETLQLSGCEEQSTKSLWSHFLLQMSQKMSNPVSLLPASFFGLHYLKKLNLSGRNLSDDRIPGDLGSLCSLIELNLSRNKFHILPPCINRLPNLVILRLDGCRTLKSIPGLPASVGFLQASDCTSMERLLISLNRRGAQFLCLCNCPELTEIQGLERQECSSYISTDEHNNLPYDFSSEIQVPNWFSHQSNGSSICFRVPLISEVESLRLLVCAVHKSTVSPLCDISLIIRNESRGYKHIYTFECAIFSTYDEDRVFLYETRPLSNEMEIESGDEIEVSIRCDNPTEVKKWGVHILVVEPNGDEEHETTVTNGESDPSANQGHNPPKYKAGSGHCLGED